MSPNTDPTNPPPNEPTAADLSAADQEKFEAFVALCAEFSFDRLNPDELAATKAGIERGAANNAASGLGPTPLGLAMSQHLDDRAVPAEVRIEMYRKFYTAGEQ